MRELGLRAARVRARKKITVRDADARTSHTRNHTLDPDSGAASPPARCSTSITPRFSLCRGTD